MKPRQVPARWARFFHPAVYWLAYGFAGLRRAKRRGYTATDLDWHVTADGVMVNLHWPTMRQNGFTGPEALMDTPIWDLTWRQVRRFRGPGGIRPRRAEAQLKRAAKAGLRVEFEPKPCPGFHKLAIWQHLAKIQAKTGVNMQVKANSVTGLHMLKLARGVGFTTFLLPRGTRRAPASAKAYVDHVRGEVTWV